MPTTFNADEILEIAVKIERNGREYYSRAAETVIDEELKKLLQNLAGWEAQHEKFFASMRSKFADLHEEAALLDPDNEAAWFLQAIADGKVFNVTTMEEELSSISEDPMDILNGAIQREKDAIILFMAMREMALGESDAEDISRIIKEEMSHIRYLSDKIEELQK